MKNDTIIGCLLALVLLLPLAACSRSEQTTTVQTTSASGSGIAQAMKEVQQQTSSSAIGAEVRQGINQAKQELLTQDIDLGSMHIYRDGRHDSDDNSKLPKAVITPQGMLVIAGKPVQATPEQHTMLMDYRQHIVGIAEAGMDIGASGADIGIAAAKQAIWGALSGKSDKEIEASIKPQTDKIEAAAATLCQRLPDLLSTQQKLAAAMPEFRPYATMRQKDVDDCGKDMTDKHGAKGLAASSH